ncbi:MAG: GNAT family N-acetyltransferase [Hellea sp.]|nr:GNAT family N-acetyltransferase [Hellea sp.]
MIGGIRPVHYPQLLKINEEFVHWLSPLDEQELKRILKLAGYARQINSAQGVIIAYPHDVDYPDHKNLNWLRPRVENFFYIDRVIIDSAAQGKGFGRQLYNDFEYYARTKGFSNLACEVNTKPDNPGSHKFHLSLGFEPIGEQYFQSYEKSVRYYKKAL